MIRELLKVSLTLILPLLFHAAALAQTAVHGMVVDQGGEGADEPSGGVAHRDRDDLVADEIRHDVQIDLPEDNEGEEHDDHRSAAVPGSSQRAGAYLVDDAEDVKRGNRAQKQGPVPDDLRLAVEERDRPGGS